MPELTVINLSKFYSQLLKQDLQNLGGRLNANDDKNQSRKKCVERKKNV